MPRQAAGRGDGGAGGRGGDFHRKALTTDALTDSAVREELRDVSRVGLSFALRACSCGTSCLAW